MVQVAENADLREFGNAGKENETQAGIGAFKHAVKAFQYRADFVINVKAIHCTEQGLVVFVH